MCFPMKQNRGSQSSRHKCSSPWTRKMMPRFLDVVLSPARVKRSQGNYNCNITESSARMMLNMLWHGSHSEIILGGGGGLYPVNLIQPNLNRFSSGLFEMAYTQCMNYMLENRIVFSRNLENQENHGKHSIVDQ